MMDMTKLYYRQTYSAYCFLADLPEASAPFIAARPTLWQLNAHPSAAKAKGIVLDLYEQVAAFEMATEQHDATEIAVISHQIDNATEALQLLVRLFESYPPTTTIETLDNWDWR
ncbi:hypothetical protein [Lactiplantibacillus pentosus]|nr:hypothetical protein [Lactiplantibacillus pentosus]CCB82980.1 putative uncharacterized protein lp_2292 [Lactiplantibacillus pentosus MP-10]CCC18466.1 putative uncharacterized protein lp_2292 [Lactiplantibacillus pentosus IG1]